MIVLTGVYEESVATDYNTYLVVAALVLMVIATLIVVRVRQPARPQRSLLFGLVATVLVLIVLWWHPYSIVDFGGHGRWISYSVWFLLGGIAATHIACLTIMWAQRRRWHDAESAMFRFMWVKALFWGTASWFFRPMDYGQPIINMVLFSLLLLTTIDLDVRLFRRYILGDDGSEQR